MSVCGNCGAEGTRIRSRWLKNVQLADECPSCAPGSFEKFAVPSDKKIWMGYEAHPNEYERAEDGGFDRKPEYRVEQEEQLRRETVDERDFRLKAEAHKRATRRVEPMDSVELQAALRKAEELAGWILSAGGTIN
jgi:hypothetical protein